MPVMARVLIALGWIVLFVACGDDDSGAGPSRSAQEEQINRSFASKSVVRLDAVSGHCSVSVGPHDSIQVEVVHAYEPAGAFEARLEVVGDVLALREVMEGSTSGYSIWTVVVPPQTAIWFSSASGDLGVGGTEGGITASTASGKVTIRNAAGGIGIHTASGDVEMVNTSGAIEVSTASGDVHGDNLSGHLDVTTASGAIEIDGADGAFQLRTASGNIDAVGLTLTAASAFSSASGNVKVKLSEGAEHNLSLSSASGKAVLSYDGNELVGYFEFTARDDLGRIVSPVAFESEEQFLQGGVTYNRKSFAAGADVPRVTIGTASGKAELRR